MTTDASFVLRSVLDMLRSAEQDEMREVLRIVKKSRDVTDDVLACYAAGKLSGLAAARYLLLQTIDNCSLPHPDLPVPSPPPEHLEKLRALIGQSRDHAAAFRHAASDLEELLELWGDSSYE